MISILTNTSQKIKDLSAITLPNKQSYADKHKYVLHCVDFEYANFNSNILNLLEKNLSIIQSSDITMTMGADTLFTNNRIKIEDIFLDSDHVLMARENINWWPVNDDVMIWRNSKESINLYKRIITDYEVWKKYPLRIQNHLWNLIVEGQAPIRLVDAVVMNQHPTKWQMGNWIVHFYGHSLEEKITKAKVFQDLWPNGEATIKKQHDSERPDVL